MRLSKIASMFLMVAFCVSKGADGFPESPPSTEKIKIISACCINDKWTFNLFDGVSGKTVSVKQGRRHAEGYQIKSFDEQTQTAVILTPRGTFAIRMNEHALTIAEEQKQTSTPQAPAQTEHAPEPDSTFKSKTISRTQILKRIR